MRRVLVLLGILLSTLAACGEEDASTAEQEQSSDGSGVHWTHLGATGPDNWGTLTQEFAACASGQSQSPIDIVKSVNPEQVDIQLDYQDSPLSIINNGHTIKVNYQPGSLVTFGQDSYELLQFHFHTPSEHTLGGSSYPMEGHLVHKDTLGNLAVVGMFFEEGQANSFFQTLIDNLPRGEGEEKTVPGTLINAQDLLPTELAAHTYSGSLTTPPCSEGVRWTILASPIEVSEFQIADFADVMGFNARPVQALHGRPVSGQP